MTVSVKAWFKVTDTVTQMVVSLSDSAEIETTASWTGKHEHENLVVRLIGSGAS